MKSPKIHFNLMILFTVQLFGCTSSNQNKEIIDNPDIDKQMTMIEQHEDSLYESSDSIPYPNTFIYIDELKKFYNHSNHYVSLFYLDNYSVESYQELINAKGEKAFQDSEVKRTAIEKKVAKKHLMIENLEKLLVFDDNQELIDTIHLQNVEYYEDMIESSFIATYQTDLTNDNYTVMSPKGFKKKDLNKSPEIKSDSLYLQQVINKNNYEPDRVYYFGYFIQNTDTFSILSFGDYQAGKECLYLLKNQTVADSVVNDFVITGMHPVPLADDSESFYVSEIAIPDTDALWTSLTGVNIKTNKLIFYPRNRKEFK